MYAQVDGVNAIAREGLIPTCATYLHGQDMDE